MRYTQTKICPRKYDTKLDTKSSGTLRRPDLVFIYKKRTCQLMDFAVPSDHKVKGKGSKRLDKYLDITRQLKIYGL